MTSLTLLNVFCGDGESAVGYATAGFRVTGIDAKRSRYLPQRFPLIEDADPLGSVLLGLYDSYDVVAISSLPDSVDIRLLESGLRERPFNWVIESRPRPEIRSAVSVTGWAFGVPLERRRFYVSDLFLFGAPDVHRAERGRLSKRNPVSEWARAIGADWLPKGRLVSATPTAYTGFVGRQIMAMAKAARGV